MYTTSIHDAQLERKILDSLALSWDQRVAVRKERLDLGQYYDPTIPDFPAAMLPFHDSPAYAALARPAQLRLLATAWVAYNEKAIFMEDEMVQPLCSLLLKGRLPGVSDARVKQVIAQLAVDEQFHILMCLEICSNARARHDLHGYRMPEPLIGVALRAALEQARDADDAALVRMVYATVAETTIHAYLQQIAADTSIQPLNRLNTDLHRRDELAHGTTFAQLARSVYQSLDAAAQARFRALLCQALDDFVQVDVAFWVSILDYAGIAGREQIGAQMRAAAQGVRMRRDYTALAPLLRDLGIPEQGIFSQQAG
ncbi:diiron oxygenase [Oxalobacteraceae bacterium]|nr:diiron oxygenase [Oxalobacteraceae bacterium]